ncbi:MAG: dihydrofolate synthase/folylpolyglutamate synthase [Polaribacter sp.]|jgi:dihydrofolate synthase/folylpolyglutamate synthase
MNHTLTSYQETLDFLFEQLPMYQRQGKAAFKKDLTNITTLCEKLGNPHDKFNSIHIAGTNGKGSTAHLIACLFQTRGLKVGLYTSPHYTDFRERIKINGEYISEEAVIEFVNNHSELFEEIQPSFFEITVAMAFDYFAKEKVDIAIVETGLGGRLDSTNIMQPDLSVITNISLDHQSMLGETLPEIAGEKAGIIKQEVPVVIGESQKEVKSVFVDKAKEMRADIVFADQTYRAELKKEVGDASIYTIYRNGKPCYNDVKVDIQGPFQEKNLATLFQCIESINDLDLFKMIREYDIRNGLPKLRELTNYKGRWQRLQENPTVICDSAHNESGLTYAMGALESMTFDQLHIVLGMVNDKEVEKMLKFFPTEAIYYFCKPDIPRGLAAGILRDKAAGLGLKGNAYDSVKEALAAAKEEAAKSDLIYVGGSTFVVAEVI